MQSLNMIHHKLSKNITKEDLKAHFVSIVTETKDVTEILRRNLEWESQNYKKMDEEVDFAFETTLASRSYTNLFSELKAKGYTLQKKLKQAYAEG